MIRFTIILFSLIALTWLKFSGSLLAQETKGDQTPKEAETAPAPEARDSKPAEQPATTPETGKSKGSETKSSTYEISPQFQMKLRELEEKVSTLKEKVFDSKTRLLLLREQILHNIIAEAQFQLIHENDMGSSFSLEQVAYYLDNNRIYFADNKGNVLDDKTEFEISKKSITPGNHILQVEMVYRGNSTLFPYLKGYKWKINSSFTFYAAKGKLTRIKSVGFKKGGITARLEDKPSVKFDVMQIKLAKGTVEEEVKGK
jgi:hypothetical protein